MHSVTRPRHNLYGCADEVGTSHKREPATAVTWNGSKVEVSKHASCPGHNRYGPDAVTRSTCCITPASGSYRASQLGSPRQRAGMIELWAGSCWNTMHAVLLWDGFLDCTIHLHVKAPKLSINVLGRVVGDGKVIWRKLSRENVFSMVSLKQPRQWPWAVSENGNGLAGSVEDLYRRR